MMSYIIDFFVAKTFSFLVLEMVPRALLMVGRPSATELSPTGNPR
jgi:hypothetical protein